MNSRKPSYEDLLLENENLKKQLYSIKEPQDSFYKDYMLFFDIVPDLLFIASIDGYFIKTNKVWTNVLGYGIDELISHDIYEIVHPDDLDETVIAVREQLSGYENTSFINRCNCKTGGYKTLEWHGIISPDGKYIFGSARDISNKIKTDDALLESENRYKNIFNNNKAVMFIVDPITGEIIDMNKSAMDFYGYPKSVLSSLKISDINILSHEEVEYEMEKALLEQKHYFQFKHRLYNGEIRDVRVYSAKVKFNKKDYLHSIVHDITEQSVAELSLKEKNEQIKQHIETKEKLFSVIAHDLRSPFNYILGLSQIMLDNLKIYDYRKHNEYIGIINTSAKNTLNLLDNLLNWTRSQTGRIMYNPQLINLSEIINGEMLSLDSLVNKKFIIFNYYQSEKLELFSDKDMLLIVLRNLVTNSIKYTNRGGRINVSTEIKNDFVIVKISDNGVGIAPEKCITLFDLSVNETTKGTENEKGSGLGLSLCKEFVEKFGGEIWVESEEGKGCDFMFTIPLKN